MLARLIVNIKISELKGSIFVLTVLLVAVSCLHLTYEKASH